MHMPEIQSVLNEKNISFLMSKRTTAEASTLSTAVCGIISGNLQTMWSRSAWRPICGMQGAMRKSKAITIRFSQNI